jgi:hypothetical protein
MWRLGIPTVLMIAFALVGLTTTPWRDTAAPPSAAVVAAVVAGTPPISIPTAPVPAVVPEDTEAIGERAEPGRETADAQGAPALRLPEELGPEAPDVVVAMELPPADAERPPVVTAHTHVPDSTDDGAHAPIALAALAGDDVQGPEPGARYWFGPRGLEQVEVLGETRR